MKPHIRDAKRQGQTLQTTGLVVKMVCFAICCAMAFGLYSCMTLATDEAREIKKKLE